MSLRRWLIKLLKAKPQEDLAIGKLFYNPDDYIAFAVDKNLNAKYDFIVCQLNKSLYEYLSNSPLQLIEINDPLKEVIEIIDKIES